jgi:NHL repeat-containing protein
VLSLVPGGLISSHFNPQETAVVHNAIRIGALVLRLIVGLALLGWPSVGADQGTGSVISLPQWVNSFPHKPGEVFSPTALAVDAAGDLYVADGFRYDRIQKRDARGSWSLMAVSGSNLGQLGPYLAVALAVDEAGNLYVADSGNNRVLKYTPAL